MQAIGVAGPGPAEQHGAGRDSGELMQYDETPERSIELLRLALPLMSRQAAALHPLSYAVWYAYVADAGSPLRHEVDRRLASHGTLDEAAVQDLFRRHVADFDSAAADRITEGLHQLIGGMSASTALANDQTAKFGHTLERASTEFAEANRAAGAGSSDLAPPMLDELLSHTQQMRDAMTRLQEKLARNQSEIDGLRDQVSRFRQESLVDALTGLPNRRAFDQRLVACLACVDTIPGVAMPCVLMADLDNFKQINDRYGHGFGDQVLRAVAQVMKSQVSEPSMAARVGGEEFAVVMPTATLDQARELAEKLRTAVAASRIRRKGQDDLVARVTLSLGATAWRNSDSMAMFVDRADQALYASKSGGRDRVTVLT